FSALPQLRGALELTEMKAFQHPIFGVLITMLCISLTLATLTRIRISMINAGVLTVHAGILLLCGGSLWYFGTKIEGDVLLQSPHLELVTNDANTRLLATLKPAAGESWSANMPAFGGNVAVKVSDVAAAPGMQFEKIAVEVKSADGVTQHVLDARSGAPVPIANDRLALRFVKFPERDTYYDHERAALHFRRTDQSAWAHAPIDALPFFRERFIDDGQVVYDKSGRDVPSKRKSPTFSLLGATLSSGWVEAWRMPIDVPCSDAPFDVQVTGYLPYISGMQRQVVSGADTDGPAASVRLVVNGTSQELRKTLFAADSRDSYWPLVTPIEFLYCETPGEIAAATSSQAGTHELYIKLEDPAVERTVAVRAGQEIKIEDAGYTIRVQQLMPTWPLMSPGFENAISPAALVEVESPTKRYTRTVIQRFPKLSQDIDESGMRRREGLYDPNLTLRYRGADNGRILLLATKELLAADALQVIWIGADGAAVPQKVQNGTSVHLELPTAHLTMHLEDLVPHATTKMMPVVEPLESRRPNLAARSASAIRLALTGKDKWAGWSDSRWMVFSQYPDLDANPIVISPPGSDESWELVYSRVPHDLKATLVPGMLTVNFFPGRHSVESWRSDFIAIPAGDTPRPGAVYTNQTFPIGKLTLFQSGAARDHWQWTILGVGTRNGIWPMLLGCVMITLGCLYAFYVKPILQKRVAAEAVRTAKLRRAPAAAPQSENAPSLEVVEV
ncbi:MAG: hypothetical protein AB7N71_11650, partial [Phycisphaerae bacterium]